MFVVTFLILFSVESLAGTPDSECSFLDTQIYDPRNYGKRVSESVCYVIGGNE